MTTLPHRLYDAALAPNPRRVRMFLAEKSIELQRVPVDLAKQEQFSEAYRAKNPWSCVPALELDTGEVITESVAICRFLEAEAPQPALFGVTALEQGRVDEWTRIVEHEIYLQLSDHIRNTSRWFAGRAVTGTDAGFEQSEQVAARAMDRAARGLRRVEQQLAHTGAWLTGDTFRVPDICLFTALEYAHKVLPPLGPATQAFLERARARPSSQA